MSFSKQLLILISLVTECASSFGFASLVGTAIEITIYAIELRICVLTAGIKKCKSITKRKNKHLKIFLLAKCKLNSVGVLIT